MITFKSRNIDGNVRSWSFSSIAAVKRVWNSENPDLPANDDPVWDIVIDGVSITGEDQLEMLGTDEIWFEDIFAYDVPFSERKAVFDTHGYDSALNERSGEAVDIIRALSDQEADIEDVGPMYRVRFYDGFTSDAFADELIM